MPNTHAFKHCFFIANQGTHWTTEIVNLVFVDGYEEKIDRTKQLRPIEFDYKKPGTEPLYDRAKTWPSPRVLMTHLPEHMMPNQIYKGKGKVQQI